MELVHYLEEGYPDGETEAVVIWAAVRVPPGGELRVRYFCEPGDRKLLEGTLYSALEALRNSPEGGPGGGSLGGGA